jgi:hypothetical protein
LLHCVCSPCAVCQEHEEVEQHFGKHGPNLGAVNYVPPTMGQISSKLSHI